MYRDTVTLFMFYPSALGDLWFPVVLRGVDLNIDKGFIAAKYGEGSKDNAILHVKYEEKNGETFIGERRWLPPKEWDAQTVDQMAATITFTSGDAADFIYAGAWPDNQPIEDDDPRWGRTGFYNYLNAERDYVFQITSVAKYSVIPHFEILAK